MLGYDMGKTIEYAQIEEKVWREVKHPCWDFLNYIYRIKPEPKFKTSDIIISLKKDKKMNKTEAIGAIYLLKQEIAQIKGVIEDRARFFMHDIRPEQKWSARRLQERAEALLAALKEIVQKDGEIDKLISEFNITEITKDNQ